MIHDVLPVLWERVPGVIWNRKCKLQNWIWLIDKSLQVIENPRLQEKFINTVNFHRKHTRCTICTFMTVYSIYCKRHPTSQIVVLLKIFKRVPSYLHTFSCTHVNRTRRIPQQLRRMTLDALQSKPACAWRLRVKFESSVHTNTFRNSIIIS